MSESCTRLEIADDGVAVLTLDRPEQLNAWNDALEAGIQAALVQCHRDDAIRCLVITGAGRAFCAGADLASGGDRFKDRPPEAAGDAIHPWDLRKPVIAAVNGHAVGVGLTFAMSCDVRFVAEDAKLAFAFVRRGVLPGFASHAVVARVAGLSNAADLMLSGRTIRGREAAALGLATRALPAEEVLPAALEWAREVARECAPVPLAISKQLIWEGLEAGSMKRREDRLFAWAGNQPDAREGVQAFLERRTPRWSGKLSRDWPDEL
jgi:enoyl-CoA hydratase/carnithine racemase